MNVGTNFFHTPINIDILTFSYESQMLLIASRMVVPFQKVFSLIFPELLGMAAIILHNVFLQEDL
jgi:hypothetical protein